VNQADRQLRKDGELTWVIQLAQRQAGWTRLQPAYLSIGDVEAREMMRGLTD